MKREFFAALLVAFIILFFCRFIFILQASPFQGDIPLQFFPWKVYIQSMLAQGELPYWNPYTYAGAPLLANMQSAVFYPLDLILLLFPIEWFYGLSLTLHLILAGLGTYFLARKCGASEIASIFAAVAYGLNGFTMIHIPAGNHLTYAGAAWVPWMFYATVGFSLAQYQRLRWLAGLCFITFLHFLCGHPQMTFYSLFFSTILCLVLCYWRWVRIEKKTWKTPTWRAAIFLAFLLLGILMAGMQLLPTLEYLQYANRSGLLSLDMATEFSFAPHRIITLFFPEYYGTLGAGQMDNRYDSFVYWSCAYAGAITPILALFLFRRGMKPIAAYPLALIGFLGLFLAWGRGNIIYTLLFQLPGFGHFRAPAKFLPYYLVPVCVLAALSIERLAAEAYDRQIQSPLSVDRKKWSISLILCIIVLFLIGIPALSGLYESVRQVADAREIYKIRVYSSMIGLVLILAGITLYQLASRTGKPRLALSLSLLLLLCLDLFTYGSAYLNSSLSRVENIARVSVPPLEVQHLHAQKQLRENDRIATLGDLYFPNWSIMWKLNNVAGYDPMSLDAYNRMIGEMENWELGSYHDNIQLRQIDHPVLDQLNVRYIFTRSELLGEHIRKVTEGKIFDIYERQNPNLTWASMSSEASLPTEASQWTAAQDIVINRYAPHDIQFEIIADGLTWLRIAEWFYPGWQAEATLQDGRMELVEIVPTEEGLRALLLPVNVREVRMYYESSWLGWNVSWIAMLIFLFVLLIEYLYTTEKLYKIVQRAMGRYY